MIKQIKNLFVLLFTLDNFPTLESRRLFEVTMNNIGKDLSPTQNELGCAETVNTLCSIAFGIPAGGGLSTTGMYQALLSHEKFIRVYSPLPGDIVISPTGYGNGNMSHGHVGVVVAGERIASNNSYNSLLEINYTINSWKERYGKVGGFPVVFFRRIP